MAMAAGCMVGRKYADHSGRYSMILFSILNGPKMSYEPSNGMFFVENSNPEIKTQWHMTRGQLLKFSLTCFFASMPGVTKLLKVWLGRA